MGDDRIGWRDLNGVSCEVDCLTQTARVSAVSFGEEEHCNTNTITDAEICRQVQRMYMIPAGQFTCNGDTCAIRSNVQSVRCPWGDNEDVNVLFESHCVQVDSSIDPTIIGIAVGVPLGVIVVVLLLVLVVILRKRRHTSKQPETDVVYVAPPNGHSANTEGAPLDVQRQDSLYMSIPDSDVGRLSRTELWNGTPNSNYGTVLVDNTDYQSADSVHTDGNHGNNTTPTAGNQGNHTTSPPAVTPTGSRTPGAPPDGQDPESAGPVLEANTAVSHGNVTTPSTSNNVAGNSTPTTSVNVQEQGPHQRVVVDNMVYILPSAATGPTHPPAEPASADSIQDEHETRSPETDGTDDSSNIVRDLPPVPPRETLDNSGPQIVPTPEGNITSGNHGNTNTDPVVRNPGYVHVLEIPRLPNRFNDG